MNKTRLVMMTALLGSAIGLAACQSTTAQKPSIEAEQRHAHQKRELTPEQRAEWQAKREQMRAKHKAERAKVEQACQGKKIGERVNVQLNNRVIEGTCEVRFTPDKSQFKRQSNATT
ncbi:heavy-metal resistance [Acinetobacter haemolyticus]|uniref:heavy-metal resistance n=1 Tax=Acinetobacter haemolyticus TaxID=29430 RepID=UPI000F736B83|nr:heavy-metal resistance [Acinetobacter haemolyticus]NAR79990.1 heavy-metal resistance [Acinetobacter haemolyticus]RSN77932.1 heavy-metal resistance [Acinetobacter haemolyticus]